MKIEKILDLLEQENNYVLLKFLLNNAVARTGKYKFNVSTVTSTLKSEEMLML